MTYNAEDFVFNLKYDDPFYYRAEWACVAGGYVRDAILGVTWVDVDLFVGFSSDKMKAFAKERDHLYLEIDDISKTYRIMIYTGPLPPGSLPSLSFFKLSRDVAEEYNESGFVSYHVVGIPCLNIILRDSEELKEPCPEELVRKFPCTASACWVEDSVVRWLPGFDYAVRKKEMDFHPKCPQPYRYKVVSKLKMLGYSDFQWSTESPYMRLLLTGDYHE